MRDGTILLVEDNPDDEALLRMALKKNGVTNEVVAVRDGEAALAALLPPGGAPGTRPALVLLDLKMPKVGGLEVLAAMRRDPRTRTVPVVVLTTSVEPRDIETAYRAGANSYLRKPVDFAEFTATIKLVGSYWLQLNRPPPPGDAP